MIFSLDVKASISKESSSITTLSDDSISVVNYYNEGGIYLGEDLSANSVSIRYWDVDYAYVNASHVANFYNEILFAMNSTRYNSISYTAPYAPCVSVASMAVLKALEVENCYETSAYPLYGTNVGRYINSNDKANHNFANYWPNSSNITLSNTYYKDDLNFPLSVLSNQYNKISYVYNEHTKLGYYIYNYGSSCSSIVTALNKYLSSEKSSSNYRYSSTTIDYNEVSSTTLASDFYNIRYQICQGNTVMIGDNDFTWAEHPSSQISGHAMVAVGAGIANVYDYSTKQWKEVKEIIYDQGGGKYCAMPMDDVYDYFIIDLNLQKKVKYGLFNLFSKWVDM